ncbi:hypothetical protein ACO2FA_13390 [Staphylococcus warneri]
MEVMANHLHNSRVESSATDGDSDYQDADAQGEQIEENIPERFIWA